MMVSYTQEGRGTRTPEPASITTTTAAMTIQPKYSVFRESVTRSLREFFA